MFIVYIIFSISTGKFYTGSTQNIENRLREHNAGETKSIKDGVPWSITWHSEVATRSEAVKLELKIKKRGAKRFLEDLGLSRGA